MLRPADDVLHRAVLDDLGSSPDGDTLKIEGAGPWDEATFKALDTFIASEN